MTTGLRCDYLVRIALAFVASVVVAPSAARAGCGDHVLVIDRGGHRNAAASTTTELPAALESHRSPLPPCHGPNCSADPVRPASDFGFPPTSSTDTKSSVESRVESDRDALACRCAAPFENGRPSVGCTDSIFHPPRHQF